MRRYLWWILGLVLVGAGVLIALSARPGPADFGWFAYTPLDDQPDWSMGWSDPFSSGSAMIVSRWQLVGGVVAAIGLMVVASGIGFHLGRRRGNERETAT